MNAITLEEFRLRQPAFPKTSETDIAYLEVANKINEKISLSKFGKTLHPGIMKRVALILTDYLQDIVSDAGVWRSFVDACRKLYGFSVPFHPVPETYVDYELNIEDVRFLVWYAVAMLDESKRDIYPHTRELIDCADEIFKYLEEEYDNVPMPESFNISRGLELHDAEDAEDIYHLGHWLFLHSYLITPAFALSLQNIVEGINMKSKDASLEFNKKLEEAMVEDTTGPLALYVPEWIRLILEGKLPEDDNLKDASMHHPYYDAFMTATKGSELAFFDDYESMNNFFIDGMGWEKGKQHLEMAKGASDYTLMVNPTKGMLLARDVAKCICAPNNPYYDRDYARKHAFELFSQRGRCPADLLRRCLKENWIPDASFPGTSDTTLVSENADFIARCYLQIYYRD